jgi:hypothetical protein
LRPVEENHSVCSRKYVEFPPPPHISPCNNKQNQKHGSIKIFVYSIGGRLDYLKHPYYALDEQDVEILDGYGPAFSDINGDYHIWRNYKNEGIVGKFQYRKWLRYGSDIAGNIIQDDIYGKSNTAQLYDEIDIENILKKDEIILAKPLLFTRSIADQFKLYHGNWLMRIKKIAIEIYGDGMKNKWEDFFDHSKIFVPCNIYVARTPVIMDYYDWLFPLLFEFCKRIDYKSSANSEYNKRIPGYLAERLLGFYFLKLRQTDIFWSHNNIDEAEMDTVKKLRFPNIWGDQPTHHAACV